MQDAILLRMAQAGRRRALSGHEVLYLNRPDRVWLIAEGATEVFFVAGDSMHAAGGRTFLFEATAGQCLFALPSEAGTPTLLALGLEATLIEMERVRFETLLRTPALHKAGSAWIDRWVTALGESVAEAPPPGRSRALEAGGVVSLRTAEIAYADAGVYWGRSTGAYRYLGHTTQTVLDATWHPVSRHLWLQAGDTALDLEVVATSTLAAEGVWASALNGFHRWAAHRLRARAARVRAEEHARLTARAEREDNQLRQSLADLSGILDTPKDTSRFANSDPADPLLAACQMVGQAQGIVLQAPPVHRAGKQPKDPVEAIAQASKVRVREVLLRGAWWQRDNGPLLAFLADELHPVALLQEKPTRYVLYDPARRTQARVTAAVAARLKPTAYMFVRSFPAEALTARALWGLGLHNTMADRGRLFVAGLAAGALGLATPILSQVLFDQVIPLADRSQLLEIALLLVVFALAAGVLELVRGVSLLRIEARMEMNLEAALMDRLLRLPASFFKRFQTGDLANRVLGISLIRRLLTDTTFTAVMSGVFSLISLALLFFYDPKLALLGLGLGGVAFGVMAASGMRGLRYNRAMIEVEGKISGLLFQFMAGIAKLRVAGTERRAFTVWTHRFARQKTLAYRAGAEQNHFEVFQAAYPILTSIFFFVLVYYLTTRAALRGEMPLLTTGTFIAVMTAFGQFLTGTLGMGMAVIASLEAVPLYERLQLILAATPEVRPEAADPGALQGEIEVRHVGFRYEANGPLILDNISFHIIPGEMVALVGPSGSGKSTLLRLLLGLEQLEAGAIYFDGQDLATLDVEAVRRQIGVVLQHGSLMPGSLFKNIVGATTHLTLDDAWEAARLAGLDDDIRQMPMGMHTLVGEGGSTFSGGQRQRLMIARAIVHNPRILLFDEATSALDNHTQHVVSESLARLQVTRIVIAHRLSTIRQADRIYVLDRGRIVQAGSCDTLLQADGLFADLAGRQLV